MFMEKAKSNSESLRPDLVSVVIDDAIVFTQSRRLGVIELANDYKNVA
jgi:hypothetical protein